MLLRGLSAAIVALCIAEFADAAHVKSFVVKCVDRQEASNDDIYLAGVRDGRPVAWNADFQEGMCTEHSFDMTDGGSLALDAKSLAELKFDKSLQIVIKEKDVTGDEVIGTVNVMPGDGMKRLVFKNEDFEYHVEYQVE